MKHALSWAAFVVVLVTTGCGSFQSAPDPATGVEAETVPIAEGHPQAPAPLDSYRADTPDLIGKFENPQLVEFFAYWCTTCRFMRPTVHQLEADYWGKVDFVYLDIDDPANSAAKQEFGFVAQPLFVLLDADGNELERWYGVVNEEDFRAAFDAAVAG